MNLSETMSYDNVSNNTNSNSDRVMDINQKNELQEYVKKWLTYDDEIRTLQNAIKERKKDKKDIGNILINFMDNNNVPHFNLPDGKLIFSKSQHTEPVNIKFLKDTLYLSPCLNETQTQNLLEFIESKRNKRVSTRLKRTHKHS